MCYSAFNIIHLFSEVFYFIVYPSSSLMKPPLRRLVTYYFPLFEIREESKQVTVPKYNIYVAIPNKQQKENGYKNTISPYEM